MSYQYALEDGKVVAFMSKRFLERAIAGGRALEAISGEGARGIMVSQITEAGKADGGEYGEWVRGLDFAGKTSEQVYNDYADIVKGWIPNV